MTAYAFLDPRCKYRLPPDFNYQDYIETEQELWALFPETEGKRVMSTREFLAGHRLMPGDRLGGAP